MKVMNKIIIGIIIIMVIALLSFIVYENIMILYVIELLKAIVTK